MFLPSCNLGLWLRTHYACRSHVCTAGKFAVKTSCKALGATNVCFADNSDSRTHFIGAASKLWLCRDDTNGNATENAVAALGKALQHTPNIPDNLGVADLWVQSLPLTVDAEEAKIAHKQLIGFIQSSDQRYACRPSIALQAVILVMLHIAACSTNHQCKATGHLPCVCKACNRMLTAGLRRIKKQCQNVRSHVGACKPRVVSQH